MSDQCLLATQGFEVGVIDSPGFDPVLVDEVWIWMRLLIILVPEAVSALARGV